MNRTWKVASALGIGAVGFTWLKSQSDDLPRDLRIVWRALQTKRSASRLASISWSAVDFWNETVSRFADREFLVYINDDNTTTTSYTYRETDKWANKFASWAVNNGIKAGDVVALMMENRPEFVFIWLGMLKVGAITALINTNLKSKPLHHCLKISGAKAFIISKEFIEVVEEMQNSDVGKENPISGLWFSWGTRRPYQRFIELEPLINAESGESCPPSPPSRRASDVVFYIYTSGTTGLPKASKISALRFYLAGYVFANALEVKPEDRVYCTLPMYHASATMLGISIIWTVGCTYVVRRKFSVSHFFPDCCNLDCTVAMYIGELCRYLLTNVDTTYDRRHKLKLMIGNGLRPDVWKAFANRYGIPRFGEFYASTEGNATLLNLTGEFGAVGFIPPLFGRLYPVKLVKYDIDNDVIMRDANGLCIPCKDGEIGELVGLVDHSDPLRNFAEYTDNAATERKFLRNVFKKGDVWYRTGDLLRKDKRGYYYFVDRIGDTFRCKGENVSTSEVEDIVNMHPDLFDSVVYGVRVPGCEGRVGMCATRIQPGKTFNPDLTKELPPYAVPVFIRIKQHIETTGTFKHIKTTLVKEGYDPTQCNGDPLYIKDDTKKTYIPMDMRMFEELHKNIRSKL